VVRSETPLSKFARHLEQALGWEGYHLHMFDVGGILFGEPDEDADYVINKRGVTVRHVLPRVGAGLRWDYDFGDGWEHDVVVEAIEEPKSKARYPICVEGAGACPPEDCGGVSGYERQVGGYRTFIPKPLPPDPPLRWDVGLLAALSGFDLALGRLGGLARGPSNPSRSWRRTSDARRCSASRSEDPGAPRRRARLPGGCSGAALPAGRPGALGGRTTPRPCDRLMPWAMEPCRASMSCVHCARRCTRSLGVTKLGG